MEAQATSAQLWLRQFVGEWDVASHDLLAAGGPGEPKTGRETVAPFGEWWIVADGEAEMCGSRMRWRMTLGFDPREDVVVGSWVDTMQPGLWPYQGSLDEDSGTLLLYTDGPSLDDPATTTRYRETLVLESPDRRTMESAYETAEGEWKTFLRSEFTRRPA